MEWVLRSPQIHSTFGNLGYAYGDGYHVNENCNSALETILHNILTEDKYLRTYRRNISFGQNITKDLIPLLIHAKDEKTVELLIQILVNLTIPVECLFSVDIITKSEFGRHTLFEINNLLKSTKSAFTDNRTTKGVIDFLKKSIAHEQKLTPEQCTNVSNSLLLLRNILHIPEDSSNPSPNGNGYAHCVQNQILWNIFSQSIDKILIKLMTIPDATKWGVTMVQVIALLYKDQHVVTLHKLLNLWLESSLSESSEDNESNTSPPDRGSEDSSPMLTSSDPTSDSSDNGGSSKSNGEPNVNNDWNTSDKNTSESGSPPPQSPPDIEKKMDIERKLGCKSSAVDNIMPSNLSIEQAMRSEAQKMRNALHCTEHSPKKKQKTTISENSDCGYGTQIENQESIISTSSNEDDMPTKKPVHQKPHNPKQRKKKQDEIRSGFTLLDCKRKKLVKRGKSHIINVQGLSHKTPTDDDIANVVKEFTVDFLLKGYNSLVQTLHNQILTNPHLEIDTSHFFWLVTYFLKFATQIELDLEHVCSVLSFDIVSYLTAEGVNLCEQFELAIKLDGNNLKPSIRRLHLVVTAIREYVQAIEVYNKFAHMCNDDQEALVNLQIKMCETEELRSLLVLLLRHYNPKYQSKQYLQDLIITNHILLMFLDSVMKLPQYKGSTSMQEHIKQFATPAVMCQYGILLEDYTVNGEFVNDCVFTLMHHVGGELGSLISLFQPKILKTFTLIWKSDFEICDDWSDLIEYVLNKFIKKPHILKCNMNLRLDVEGMEDDKAITNILPMLKMNENTSSQTETKNNTITKEISGENEWTEIEISSLSWNYLQCNTSTDYIGNIIKLLKDDGITKTRDSVITELFKQNLINETEYNTLTKEENDKFPKVNKPTIETREEEIGKLCEQLVEEGKGSFLNWVQSYLLEACFVKIHLEKKALDCHKDRRDAKILSFELFKEKDKDLPIMAPVSYHSMILNQSIPLVPWNCEQAAICKDLKFLQLLHKLGFHMPVDSGKVFIRIPHFWTADLMYDVAGKISLIDVSKLKFSINDISSSSLANSSLPPRDLLSSDLPKDIAMIPAPENFYQVHKQKHLATMVNFTPMPGTSFNSNTCDDTRKQNWLEVVQKSQECKMSFKLRSNTIIDGEDQTDVGMDHVSEEEDVGPKIAIPPIAPPQPNLVTPTVMSAKQDSPDYNIQLLDSEFYNNSLCETASVASDLTRMYVSDEDEKPEITIRQQMTGVTLMDEDDHDVALDGSSSRINREFKF